MKLLQITIRTMTTEELCKSFWSHDICEASRYACAQELTRREDALRSQGLSPVAVDIA